MSKSSFICRERISKKYQRTLALSNIITKWTQIKLCAKVTDLSTQSHWLRSWPTLTFSKPSTTLSSVSTRSKCHLQRDQLEPLKSNFWLTSMGFLDSWTQWQLRTDSEPLLEASNKSMSCLSTVPHSLKTPWQFRLKPTTQFCKAVLS